MAGGDKGAGPAVGLAAVGRSMGSERAAPGLPPEWDYPCLVTDPLRVSGPFLSVLSVPVSQPGAQPWVINCLPGTGVTLLKKLFPLF